MSLPFITLPHAEGAIQPTVAQQERLEEITERLASGEFHSDAEALIPVICKDGRYGGYHLLPNAAGGTETLFIARDLLRDVTADEPTTLEGYTAILARLHEKGALVGGHDDGQPTETITGCGANDRLPEIYRFIAKHGSIIRALAESLGVMVTDEIHEKLVAAANRNDFSEGGELLQALIASGDDVVVEHLDGIHQEVAAVINTREGTTLDRRRLQAEFGDGYQSFNVDVWSFEEAARLIADDDSEVPALVAGMVYYNLATAHVLGGPDLRIIVLS